MGANEPNGKPANRIQVRIRPDGRVYLDGLDADIMDIAESLNPQDASLRRRLALRREAGRRSTPTQEDTESRDGNAETGK